MENQYEDEIDLMTLLFKVCQRWRVLLAVTAVSAVVIGGTKLAMNILQSGNAGNREVSDAEYRDILDSYEAEGEALQQEMADNQKSLQQLSDYNNKSMLMKVDPYNEWAGSMNLYIDAGRQSAPGNSDQSDNTAYKIVYAYYDYYAAGFYSDVMGRLSFDMGELRYLREVLGISIDTDRYSITINAVADTREHCDELIKAAGEVFQSRHSSIASSLGEHSLTLSDAASNAQINMNRVQYQQSQTNKEKECRNNVDKLDEKYSEWKQKKPTVGEASSDRMSAVKNGIKWFIIAAAAGGFLSFAVLFVKYMLSGRIKSADDLGRNIYTLAELPVRRKKKSAIDRLIYRLFGIAVKESEYDSRLEAMALSLKKMLDAGQGEKGMIAFVGDVEETELKNFVKQVGNALPEAYKAVAAGDIIAEPAAAKAAYEADAVVLVAEQDVTMKKNYAQIHDKLFACKVEILGVVLLGVESI